MTDRDWLIATYDGLVAAHAEAGAPLEEIRSEFTSAYADAVAAGNISAADFDDLRVGGILFDQVIRPERTRRRSSFKVHLGYLSSILIGTADVDGESIDPILSLAHPTGTGVDKVLGLWNVEDWKSSVVTRYRNAADATAAAQEHDLAAQAIIAAFEATQSALTRDIFASAQIEGVPS